MVSSFIKKTENITVYVADNKIDKDLLHEIITSLIYEIDYSAALKLKIYRTLVDFE